MNKLETILEEYNIPEWANWIAIDGDGCCFGYQDKPLINEKYREWEVPPENVYGFISKGVPPKDFTQELYEIIWSMNKLEKIPEDWNMPEWVKWIAVDANGCTYGYPDKPIINEKYREWIGSTFWNEDNKARYFYRESPPKDYTQELYEVVWTYE